MKTILVIEDQPLMRRNLVTILEMEGYEVLVADNGRTGIEVAQDELPDLILCDIMMPGVDGYGVLTSLRAHKSTAMIPFIFLTARAEKSDFRTGMNLGADDYLTKPVAKADLLAALAARAERQRATEEHLRQQMAKWSVQLNFDSPAPLMEKLGLTPREAEVLLWVAQGKSNADIAVLLTMSEKTVKKRLGLVFEKLGLSSRTSAALRAIEVLSSIAPCTLPRQ